MANDGRRGGYGPPMVQAPRPRMDRETAFSLNIWLLILWATVLAPWAAWMHDRPTRVAPGGDREEGALQGALMWWSCVFFWIVAPTLFFLAAPLLFAPQLMAVPAMYLLGRRILAAKGFPVRFWRDAVPLVWARRRDWAWVWAVWTGLLTIPYTSFVLAATFDWSFGVTGRRILTWSVLLTAAWTVVIGILFARELRAIIAPPILRRRALEVAVRTALRVAPADPVRFDVHEDGTVVALMPHHAAAAPEPVQRAVASLFPDHAAQIDLQQRHLILNPLSEAEIAERDGRAASLQASGGLIAGEAPSDVAPPMPPVPHGGAAPWSVFPG